MAEAVPNFSIGRAAAIEVTTAAATRLAALFDTLPIATPAARGVAVVDAAVVTTEFFAGITAAVGDRLAVHVVPPGEPTADSVDAAAAAVRAVPGGVVVGVGGGSALDTAKQAAVAAEASASIEAYALCAVPFAGRRTIVAIPTTSGTGSEVTRTCIFTDRAGSKVWTWGDEMLPDIVLLDPLATVTMPAAVTASTGLDAFVHSIEAASGRRRNPLVVAPAAQAIRLVRTHLAGAVARPADLEARSAMQQAALLAGLAIDGAGTGIAHSIGHALGTLAKIPHGVAVSVGLLAALDWNVGGAADSYAPLATALGVEPADLIGWFGELTDDVGLSRVVGHLGALPCDTAAIADQMVAPENMPMLTNNARPAAGGDCEMLAAATVATWERLR